MPIIKLIPKFYSLIDERDPEVRLSEFAKKGKAKSEDTDYFEGGFATFAPGYKFVGYGPRRVMKLAVCHDDPNDPRYDYSYCKMPIGVNANGEEKELIEPGNSGILFCGLGQVPAGGPAVIDEPGDFYEKFYPNACEELGSITKLLFDHLQKSGSEKPTLNFRSKELLEGRLIRLGMRMDEPISAGKLTYIFERLGLAEPSDEIVNQIMNNGGA